MRCFFTPLERVNAGSVAYLSFLVASSFPVVIKPVLLSFHGPKIFFFQLSSPVHVLSVFFLQDFVWPLYPPPPLRPCATTRGVQTTASFAI